MLNAVVRNIDKLKYLIRVNSPSILTGFGISGTVITAYLTGRASFKAAKILDSAKRKIRAQTRMEHLLNPANAEIEAEAEENIELGLALSTKIRLIWKYYVPPVIAGVTTIACIFVANRISSAKIAALTTAAGISERALQEYKEKIIERLGDKQDQKIRDEVAQDRVTKFPPSSEVMIGSSGDVLFMDEMTGRYFHSTVEDVKRAENAMNRELLNNMSVSLSEFQDELGLPPTKYTEEVGWNPTHQITTYFSTVMTPDNRPCIVMGFEKPPFLEYRNIWS